MRGVFPLVIAIGLVSILCLCMFLLKPPKAVSVQVTSCSLLAFKWSSLYIIAMESPKLSPTAFQKQKANKVAAAAAISTLNFFLKSLVCGPLQDLDVPDGVTVAAKVLLAGPG